MPQVESDIVKDLVKGFVLAFLFILVMALVFGAPYRPTVRIRTVARTEPILFLQTAMGDLMGTGQIATYGPPYNNGTGSLQSIGSFSPQAMGGITHPLDPLSVDILRPLDAVAGIRPGLKPALQRFLAASPTLCHRWEGNYEKALAAARVSPTGVISLPAGAYGPISTMMQAELDLGRSGLMAGALDQNGNLYNYNFMPALLFLQGNAMHQIAGHLGMLGNQWGIIKEENTAYPGPWWLVGYTFLYQIPPYSTSPSGDLYAVMTMLMAFSVLALLPFIPGLRSLPIRLRLYRLVWFRYYRQTGAKRDLSGGKDMSDR